MRMRAVAALLMGICGIGIAAGAQSHDANHPTALAPGVNKGNVDSIVGPDYWYFTAMPGHIQVHVVFHEMGFLGQPHRQKANFDFIHSDGRSFHMEVWSQGNDAVVNNHGDFTAPDRMVVKVTGQSNLVRLGGLYEITINGPGAKFDGAAGSTANVKLKESEALIHPMQGSLIHPQGALVQPAGGVGAGGPGSGRSGSGDGSLIHPQGPLVYPGKPLLVHETQHEVKITLAADVLFDFGKSDLRPDAEKTLREAATKMKFVHAAGPIRVEGFTDAKGPAQLNQRLSEARAAAVEDWMVRNAAFSARELAAKGFGAARPVAANTKPDGSDNPEGRQLNRRVEIVVKR